MRVYLLYVSLFFFLFLSVGCSSYQWMEDCSVIIEAQTEQSEKYNLQIDFRKHHFSGILLIKRMNSSEIRIIGATHFGLSLFDFSIKNNQFIINDCIEPLKKKKLLKLLERDFKQLLLSNQKRKIKSAVNTSKEFTYGKFIGKTKVKVNGEEIIPFFRVQLKHPMIGLVIILDPINEK